MVQQCKRIWFHNTHDGSEDLFAHFSSIEMEGFKTLKQGQEVNSEITDECKGKMFPT